MSSSKEIRIVERDDAPDASEATAAFFAAEREFWEDEPTPVGEVVARTLVEAFGLKPFVSPSGRLGIHFMRLDRSMDAEETLLSEVRLDADELEEYGPDAGVSETLAAWRSTLLEALAAAGGASVMTLPMENAATEALAALTGAPDSSRLRETVRAVWKAAVTAGAAS